MNSYFAVILLLLLSTAMTGCNTTRGVGQDVEAAGQKIEELADDVQEELSDDDR